MSQTFYDILEVDHDATQEEIEDAYRQQVKATHPDLNDGADAADAFREVVRAEEVLGDPDERARYDSLGHESYVAGAGDLAGPRGGEDSAWGTGENPTRRSYDVSWAARAAGDADSGDRRDPTDRREHDHYMGGVGWSEARSGRQRATVAGTAEASEGGYAVHQWDLEDTTLDPVDGPLGQESPVLIVAFFFIYPVLLFSSVTPTFPLVVNVVVGACTLLMIGYLMSIPQVAIAVYGIWSLLAPLGVAAWPGWSLLSVTGLAAIGACWVPLGYSLLIALVLRW